MRIEKMNKRSLRIESLETRAMLSGVSSSVDVATILESLKATLNSDGNYVIPVHAQVGSTSLEVVLGVAQTLDSLQSAVNAYLNSVPGWHLTGSVDTSPEYSGVLDGTVVISTAGVLKSANVKLTASVDVGGAVEGYYGISVLHVGVGAAADVSANLSATASYSCNTNSWYFNGSASVDGYVKGYAAATAWPLKGEVYIKGEMSGDASLTSDTGLATASITVSASVGANAQMKSLFGGWKTIASTSKNLAYWQCSASYDVGSWLKSSVGDYVATAKAALGSVAAIIASQISTASTTLASVGSTTVDTTVDTKVSVAADTTVSASTTVASASTKLATSTTASSGTKTTSSTVLLSALESLSTSPVTSSGYVEV